MPRRNDIHRILIVGSGPIIIGQACEFDYSGTQACKALKADGFEVVLVNSNPATIMTDPDLADRTYVEPLTRDFVEEVIRRERPDALLSTVCFSRTRCGRSGWRRRNRSSSTSSRTAWSSPPASATRSSCGQASPSAA